MSLTTQQVEKLLMGKYRFQHLSFSMMLVRLKMLYMKDPSPSALQDCSDEICKFLTKFESKMNADVAVLAQL